MDAGWGPPPIKAAEPELFFDVEPDPTGVEMSAIMELDVDPDPETDTFMMVDLVFDEESGPFVPGAPLATIEPFVPRATTGAPRVLSKPRTQKRWPLGRRRPQGPPPRQPSRVNSNARDLFPDALSDGDLALLIQSCTEELCGW